jgi:hypothetical protein
MQNASKIASCLFDAFRATVSPARASTPCPGGQVPATAKDTPAARARAGRGIPPDTFASGGKTYLVLTSEVEQELVHLRFDNQQLLFQINKLVLIVPIKRPGEGCLDLVDVAQEFQDFGAV